MIFDICLSVPLEQIPRIHLLPHVIQAGVVAVGDDGLCLLLESLQIVHHLRAEERRAVLQRRLVDDDLRPFGLHALHHPLYRALAEVVTVRFHGQAEHPDDARLLLLRVESPPVVVVIIPRLVQHLVRDEVLACAVALHDGMNQVLRHVRIVRQQLLRVLGQAVAPVSEARVVVVRPDARVQTDAVDDGLRVQPLHLRIRVQLVEVAHAQRQIRVGKQLHRLRLLHPHEERVDVLLERTLLQQCREGMRRLLQLRHVRYGPYGSVFLPEASVVHHLRITHDDATRIQVVIQRLALSEELRREQQVQLPSLHLRRLLEPLRILHVQAPAV